MNGKKENYKILFIDDEKGLCAEFREYVTCNTNHIIDLAYNGQEAIDILEREYYDAIVLDLKMPVMDGEEVFPIILGKYPKLAIVILTAYGDIRRASKMVREGAYDFISKGTIDIEYVLYQVLRGIKEKRTKEALRVSEEERYNDLKIFSKGAAHQFKNSAYRSSMELSLLENLMEDVENEYFPKEKKDKVFQYIDSLKREATRSRYIALRMKAMDDKFSLKKTGINTKEFMENLIQYYCIQISDNLIIVEGENLTLKIDPDVPDCINVDKHYLKEAFIDLLDNAYDAAIPGEENEIKCDINVKMLSGEDGDGVLFTFQDNGRGISDEDLKYVETPFYTTKGSEGIGLGVPYVKCVVEKHNGKLEIDPEPHKKTGTRVDVYIPVTDKDTKE